ncbi:hypothetical protein OF83DRAFT_138610 [Amylostereum chailletii]|nr:hypothetical protein OF83DRAFT_138610 [Amylostereum chailletii]
MPHVLSVSDLTALFRLLIYFQVQPAASVDARRGIKYLGERPEENSTSPRFDPHCIRTYPTSPPPAYPFTHTNMFFALKAVALAAVAALVPVASADTHAITVGINGTLTFTPNQVAAAVGDIVQFTFVQKNHSATQTSFDTPCTPLPGGINAGFNPVPAGQTDNFPTFNFTVETTDSLWFSCQQVNHCPLFGMTFALNPTADQTYDEFRARALGQA